MRNGLSTHRASARYGIPRTTIRNHLYNKEIVKHLGRYAILTEDQERDLVSSIIKFSESGLVPPTPKNIQVQAFAFCQKFKIANNFNKQAKMAGKAWLRLFLNRNPDIRTQIISGGQAQKLKKPIKEIQKLYDELNLHEIY